MVGYIQSIPREVNAHENHYMYIIHTINDIALTCTNTYIYSPCKEKEIGTSVRRIFVNKIYTPASLTGGQLAVAGGGGHAARAVLRVLVRRNPHHPQTRPDGIALLRRPAIRRPVSGVSLGWDQLLVVTFTVHSI